MSDDDDDPDQNGVTPSSSNEAGGVKAPHPVRGLARCGTDEIRTRDLLRDRQACWATTPRLQ